MGYSVSGRSGSSASCPASITVTEPARDKASRSRREHPPPGWAHATRMWGPVHRRRPEGATERPATSAVRFQPGPACRPTLTFRLNLHY